MEHQERPQNIQPEESEQKQEETQEGLKQEEESAPSVDVQEIISKKEESIEDTQQRINEIRDQLGLSPSQEVPPALVIDKGVVEKMKEGQENSESSKLFEKNLRNLVEDISSSSRTMLDALYERQEQRLTPIQSNEHFQGMVSVIKKLKNFDGKITPEVLTEITADIGKLGRMFDEFSIQRTSQVKENTQNLEKLAFGAKQFANSVDGRGRALGPELEDPMLEEKRKELRKSMSILSDQAQKLSLFASKMRHNLN